MKHSPIVPGPSVTAVCVAALRATYDCAPPPLRVVHDPFARKLIPRPLARIIALTDSRPRLAYALHRALAVVTRELSTNLPLRTAAIDEALRSALRDHPTQVVLLGAGLDARAWRMPELAPCKVFEVDRPGAHRIKRRKLARCTPYPRSHHMLAVDFERQTVGDALLQAGFEPSAATVWLWEAVTMYLTPAATHRALDGIASLSGPGSSFIATYTPLNLGQGKRSTLHWRLAARVVGESIRGEMSQAQVHEAVRCRGFDVLSDDSATEWVQRYWPPSEHHHARGWERLVVARKPGPSGSG